MSALAPARPVGRQFLLALAFSVALVEAPQLAHAQAAAPVDVTELSLEDLLHVRITSASRKEESLFGASAAVFVISGDDARRAGALDLSDALRLAPGVQVGRISQSDIALSPRGFNDISANKLLALVDGRSIYTPLFGGVQWREQDLVMDDLERIEVIRGPGAPLWGSNAVNGVVNITTKSAHDTIGTLFSLKFGDRLARGATLRHGFSVDSRTDARVSFQTLRRDALIRSGEENHPLDSHVFGFRADRRTRNDGTLTLTGGWTEARSDSTPTVFSLLPPYLSRGADRNRHSSGHLLARYRRALDERTELVLQTYAEHVDSHGRTLDERSLILDVEATLRRRFGDRHDLVAGLGARDHSDEIEGSDQYVFAERKSSQTLFTSFVQDEIALLPDRLSVTLGSKFEHNEFTGWEIQPGARFSWHENQRWTWWGSVARAVRLPSRAERGTTIYPQIMPPSALNPLPTVVQLIADPAFGTEELLAWETGVRFQVGGNLTFDLSAYRNDYDGLRSIEPVGTTVLFSPAPYVRYTSMSGNGLRGVTHGLEALASWRITETWHVQASWATIRYDLELAPGSRDTTSLASLPGSTPRHEFKLFSRLDLADRWSLDTFIWHQTELSAHAIPAYTGLNLRLAWRIHPRWEIQLIGQDLLDSRHPEFPPTFLGGATQEVPRSVRMESTWRF